MRKRRLIIASTLLALFATACAVVNGRLEGSTEGSIWEGLGLPRVNFSIAINDHEALFAHYQKSEEVMTLLLELIRSTQDPAILEKAQRALGEIRQGKDTLVAVMAGQDPPTEEEPEDPEPDPDPDPDPADEEDPSGT